MSEEMYCCEFCGYGSSSKERCTRCGSDIAHCFNEETNGMHGVMLPAWGRITVRLLEPSHADVIWKEVGEVWDWLEQHTEHQFLLGQMEKFKTQAASVELHGSEFGARKIKEVLQGRGSIEFEELPDDQIPHRPIPPRPAHWREPYVPRRKR